MKIQGDVYETSNATIQQHSYSDVGSAQLLSVLLGLLDHLSVNCIQF